MNNIKMSKDLNISVLVAARDEYIEQLKCIVVPLLIQGYNSIYSDALKITEGKKTIYKFQELLKEIPQWNQTILQEESRRIKKKCPYIMDIVTAIFVSNVKILASVRLKGNNENIKVKIPTSDIFIHSIYIEAAQQIFYDPFLFYHRSGFGRSNQENKEHVRQIIRYSVDETIRQMLPFDDILQEYLANALNDDADRSDLESGSEGSEDSEDPELNGEDLVGSEDPGSESESEPEDPEPPPKEFQFDTKNNFIPQPPPPPAVSQNITTFDQIPEKMPPPPLNSFGPGPQFINEPGSDSDSDSSSSSSSSSGSSSRSYRHRERRHNHGQQQPQQPQQPQQHRQESGYSYF